MAIADVKYTAVQEYSSGRCVPVSAHQQICTNQTSGDGYCDCLADAANLCVQAHDPNYWKFMACMFRGNGYPAATSGLASDTEFESTVQDCASNLAGYSFDDLKTCYTGVEGALQLEAASKRASEVGAVHPVWLYVNGQLVAQAGRPDPTADLTRWAAKVKVAICGAYNGALPASCSSSVAV